MEEQTDTRYLEDLALLDPEDWLNIPKPIVSALLCIKRVLMKHHHMFQGVDKNLQFVDDKVEVKAANLKESLNDVNDQVFNVQMQMQASVEEIEQRLNKRVLRLKNEITSEVEEKVTEFNKRLVLTNEQLQNANKKIEALPTHQAVDTKIAQADDALRTKILHEVDTYYVKPESNKLNRKVDDFTAEFRAELDRRLKIVETRVLKYKVRTIEQLERQEKEQRAYVETQIQQLQTNLTAVKHSSIKNTTNIIDLQQTMNKQKQELSDLLQQESNARALLKKELDEHVQRLSEHNQTLAFRHKKLSKRIKEVHSSLSQELASLAESHGNAEIAESLQQSMRPPELPLDQIYAEVDTRLDQLRAELTQGPSIDEQLVKIKAEVEGGVQELLGPVQAELEKSREQTHTTVREVKEKLAWLPLSLCQLEGMGPTEARLFTIEARLRSEENLRLKIQRDLRHLFEQLNLGTTLSPLNVELPDYHRRTLTAQHGRRNKTSLSRPREESHKRGSEFTEEVFECSEEVVKYAREKYDWFDSLVNTPKPQRIAKLPVVIKRVNK